MSVPSGNRLSQEKSPYLLQHARNPVGWFPWGEEAFRKAREEDKPVFLSIGYSTCHWCHVMAHESFEDEAIARILNEQFVPVKVDREERPDIDNIYMTAVTAISGTGGWPLSVFLTPDQKPFYGGTYFPPEPRWGSPGFRDILLSIANAWKNRRDQIYLSGEQITSALTQRAQRDVQSAEISAGQLAGKAAEELGGHFDAQNGGFGQAPKFPMGHTLSFLLRLWTRTKDPQILRMVERSLEAMSEGGIYDHVGGGFHRYSTDAHWHVPHFEKMLYDQAILARVYAEAYQATGKDRYARTAREVLDYVLREMRGPEGGFYSAQDADSPPPEAPEGHAKEGAFYVWRREEIAALLGPDAEIFCYVFGVESDGNAANDPHGEFTGQNILFRRYADEQAAQHFQRPAAEIAEVLSRCRQRLLAVRARRPRPYLDDKVMTDWNGMMIGAFAAAGIALDEPVYRKAAREAADFILARLRTADGRLLHRYRDNEAAILGNLEDHAFLVSGLLDVYEATFETKYLSQALGLTEAMTRLFADARGGYFFTGQDAEQLIIRHKEVYDGAIPSGNSVALGNLVRLSQFTMDGQWRERAEAAVRAFAEDVAGRPSAYAQFLSGMDLLSGPVEQLIIAAGENPWDSRHFGQAGLGRPFVPRKVVMWRPPDEQGGDILALAPHLGPRALSAGGTTYYLCEGQTCHLPTRDVRDVLARWKA